MVKKEVKVENELSRTSSSMISKKKYKGVRMRSWGSWVSEIRAPNQKTRIWLGSYSTPEAAARAYDAALLCLKGPTANLNFSHTQYDHDYSTTIMSPKSIQKIAAAAAASTTATTTPSSPVPSYPSPSPSSSPSPSYSSSVSYNTSTPPTTNPTEEDDAFFSANDPLDGTLMSLVAPWYNFGSPAYDDVMFDTSFFELDQSSSTITKDVCEEESGDIYLWSFCR
ncbi:ethylene-responsive transcription factor ERF014 [Lactuca sativa]|uniref:ethylene-responsive transcription factor ERF014 n=1 Tax=Lactuca sativa TaxID=4236 RepID=UPI000CD885EB|nr:ethylene-responsive transcription factor ERF014 [Lactuca sativa]